jgi:hypothetical protein
MYEVAPGVLTEHGKTKKCVRGPSGTFRRS